MPKTQQFTGSKVRAFYKGNMVNGTVGDEVQPGSNNGGRAWTVSFEDGYSTHSLWREKNPLLAHPGQAVPEADRLHPIVSSLAL